MPSRLEVCKEPESEEFEAHLDREDDNVEHVEGLYDLLPDRSLLQGDILEGQCQTGSHDEEEDGPLESSVLHDAAHCSPEPRAADTERPAADHAAVAAVVATVLVVSFPLIDTRYV